ncbi:hypothetical protein CRUP_008147, partial [Coryphaenoides rupestris]
MLADDMACNHRNPKPATVFSHKNMELNVTVENFLRVLTGRLPPSTPRSKRLLSDDRSNILIYLTGTTSCLFIIDTCQGASMYERFYSPNLMALASSPSHRTDLFLRDPGSVLITDFFGSVRKVEITTETINLTNPMEPEQEKLLSEDQQRETQSYVDQLPVSGIIH